MHDRFATLAPGKKSPETFYLIKITKEFNTKDYNDTEKRQKHLSVFFWTKIEDQANHIS